MNKEQITEQIVNYIIDNITEIESLASIPYSVDELDRPNKMVTKIKTPVMAVTIKSGEKLEVVVAETSLISKDCHRGKNILTITELTELPGFIDVVTDAIDSIRESIPNRLNAEKYCQQNGYRIDVLCKKIQDKQLKSLFETSKPYIVLKQFDKTVIRYGRIINQLADFNQRYDEHAYIYDSDILKAEVHIDKIKRELSKIEADKNATLLGFDISKYKANNLYGYSIEGITKMLNQDGIPNAEQRLYRRTTAGHKVIDIVDELLQKLIDDYIEDVKNEPYNNARIYKA